ncbi:MAG: cytochrome C oxidase subunit I [Betaproteobacteria bacterium]|nr:cytochrome C oxidase subunit I [Betaproteobacteria bacterium]
MPDQPRPNPSPDPAARRRNRIKLLAILAVCAAPVIASYFTYYILKPEGRTNYGELIEPQVPVAAMTVSELPAPVPPPSTAATSNAPAESHLGRFRGRWVMLTLTAADGRCAADCAQRLYVMRQVRLTTGKDRDRIERVLLLPAEAPAPTLPEGHEGLQVLRADAAGLSAIRAALASSDAAGILLIDPLGNLMMRFPADPDASRMKKDLAKLLRASRVG